MTPDDKQASKRAGLRIFIYFLTAFLIVTAVNAVFIYKAVTTHTGEVTDNPYQRGLAYNKTIAAAAAEDRLGWTSHLAVDRQTPGVYDILLKVTDKHGETVLFDRVEGIVRRPLNAENDVTINFLQKERGAYKARVLLPLPGQWEVDVVMKAGHQPFHVVKRIVIQ